MNTSRKSKPRLAVQATPDMATVLIHRVTSFVASKHSHISWGRDGAPNNKPSIGQITAAVLLAEAIESKPGLEMRLCSARPIVLLKSLDDEIYDDICNLTVPLFGRPDDGYHDEPYDRFKLGCSISFVPARFVPPTTRTSNGKRIQTVAEIDFEGALEKRAPIIMLLAPGFEVPEYFSGIEHTQIEIGVLSPAGVRRVLKELFPNSPSTDLDKDIAAALTLFDLYVAIHASDSAEDCIGRLVKIEPTIQKPLAAEPIAPISKEISFGDLVGYGEAKVWGSELLLDFAQFRAGELAWDDFPNRCILLSGPPGTGKTRFMHALANAAGIPLIATSVAEWNFSGYLGASLKAIRRSFSDARAKSPAILFIDEIDGIGSRADFRRDSQYWSQLANLVLTEISDLQLVPGVILVAATNYPDIIDPAILRSGRLDLHIPIKPPTEDDLVVIIDQYTDGKISLHERQVLAKASMGSTGADIELFARRARAIARRAGHPLSGEDLATAMGQRFNGMDPATRRLVSVHEAGHVAVAKILGRDVQEVYLTSGGGITVFDPARYDLTESDLMDTICIMIAGRSAEEIEYGKVRFATAVGATSDLAVATKIAESCELDFGYGVLGQVQHNRKWRDMPEYVANAIERRVSDGMARANSLLVQHEEFHNEVSATLFRTGRVLRDEINTIAKRHGV